MKADSATTTTYYPIMYPFSVDRDKDLKDPLTPSGHFQRLVNFIPRGQVLRTRNGIEELLHTADTWAPPLPPSGNDFSGDANCISWYKLDKYSTGNQIIDEISGNNMTGGSTSNSAYITQDLANSIAVGLSSSVSLDNWAVNNSAWAVCTYANMIVKIPGTVGVDTTMSVCGWMRWTGDDGINAQGIISMWNTAVDRAFLFYIFSTNDTFRLLIRDTANVNIDITSSLTPTIGNWYHFLFSFSSADLTSRVRICNSSGVTQFTANATTGKGRRTYNGNLTLGTFNEDSTRCLDGNMQELCIFSDVVSEGEQDSIIAGTYSG